MYSSKLAAESGVASVQKNSASKSIHDETE
ncbi:DUF1508 domain-containing protein [Photobacterium damselae]